MRRAVVNDSIGGQALTALKIQSILSGISQEGKVSLPPQDRLSPPGTNLSLLVPPIMATRETRPLKIYATLLQAASASTSARLELLDHVRLHNLRVPKIILEHGTKVLNSGTSIGDRRWDIMEQVVVAALDNGLDDVAAQYILPLRQQFPDSQRVKRLSGMALEAKGDYNGVSDCFPPTRVFSPYAMRCMFPPVHVLKSL